MKTDFSKAIDILADWCIKNGRLMKDSSNHHLSLTIRRFLKKAGFCSIEEVKKFYNYFKTPEGKEEFIRVIRTKAKKAGLRK